MKAAFFCIEVDYSLTMRTSFCVCQVHYFHRQVPVLLTVAVKLMTRIRFEVIFGIYAILVLILDELLLHFDHFFDHRRFIAHVIYLCLSSRLMNDSLF